VLTECTDDYATFVAEIDRTMYANTVKHCTLRETSSVSDLKKGKRSTCHCGSTVKKNTHWCTSDVERASLA
jgi:hypothetical protein